MLKKQHKSYYDNKYSTTDSLILSLVHIISRTCQNLTVQLIFNRSLASHHITVIGII
jgi:hypothetical protein